MSCNAPSTDFNKIIIFTYQQIESQDKTQWESNDLQILVPSYTINSYVILFLFHYQLPILF